MAKLGADGARGRSARRACVQVQNRELDPEKIDALKPGNPKNGLPAFPFQPTPWTVGGVLLVVGSDRAEGKPQTNPWGQTYVGALRTDLPLKFSFGLLLKNTIQHAARLGSCPIRLRVRQRHGVRALRRSAAGGSRRELELPDISIAS